MFTFIQGLLLFIVAVILIIMVNVIIRAVTKSKSISSFKNSYYVSLDVVASNNTDFEREFNAFFNKYRTLNVILIFITIIILIITGLLCARPGEQVANNEQVSSRDIILCLDASESTLINDRKIIESYKALISSFSGERVSLQIFNSSSRIVFPLTNDYDLANTQFNIAIKALDPIQSVISVNSLDEVENNNLLNFLSGTTSRSDSVSLISDGLVQCALPLISDKSSNNRSIVFVTDNYLGGKSKFSLNEATKLVSENNISLYSIYSGDTSSIGQQNEEELKNATESSGGTYFSNSNPNMMQGTITQIEEQNKSISAVSGEYFIKDNPSIILMVFMGAFLLYLLVRWRLKN